MKLYLAAPWADKDQMEIRSKVFEDAGHTITWKWWDTPNIPESDSTQHSELRRQAENDYNGVVTSQLVVLFNTSKSEGKAVEQGVAIAHKKPIIAVGTLGDGISLNVFHYLSTYRWEPSILEAVKAVNLLQWCIDASRPEESV